jgi:hypothetical protein
MKHTLAWSTVPALRAALASPLRAPSVQLTPLPGSRPRTRFGRRSFSGTAGRTAWEQEIEHAVQAEDWLRFKKSMLGLDVDAVRSKLINWLEVHDYSQVASLQVGSVFKSK